LQGSAGGGNNANNGGGGGGGRGTSGAGTAGNSGIVVFKYPTTYPAATTTGTVSYSTAIAGYRIYTFTGSGTIIF
jgi:hypothetical protein